MIMKSAVAALVVSMVAMSGCGGTASPAAADRDPPSLDSVDCPNGVSGGTPLYASGERNDELPQDQARRTARRLLGEDYPRTRQVTLYLSDTRQDIVYEEPDGTRRAILLFKKNEELGWHVVTLASC